MDNKGNQNKNGKNPRGQNYAVLIMTMLFTLLCVAMMHNLWQGSRTHKMPYSEFNQMLKDHEVESVVIGNGKIQITPKEDSKKYGGSQGKYGNLVGMEYYTIPINDPDLEKKLDEAVLRPMNRQKWTRQAVLSCFCLSGCFRLQRCSSFSI